MQRALITGASGFIGSHLAATLVQQGVGVRCLVRPTSRTEQLNTLGVQLVEGDVRDPSRLAAAVRGTDVVYHLAGLTKALSLDALLRVNRQGVENVARASAQQPNPPVLLVVSSLAAAGPSLADRPRTEAEPSTPVSNYGRSKLGGEVAARGWADQMPISIVRPPIVLGEGDREGWKLFRVIARRGLHVVPAMGAARVSIIHADDLVTALQQVADRGQRVAADNASTQDPQGGVYFVAAEIDPTYVELGHLVAGAVGRQHVRVLHAPRPLVRTAALLGEAVGQVRRKPTLFNLDKFREAIAGSWTCSADRIHRELGFLPTRSLEQRLRQTADWYRREGWL